MASFCSSYIPTGAAAVTRAADACSWPFLASPQAMTLYVDGYELGTDQTTNGRVVSIENAADGDPRLLLYSISTGGKYGLSHLNPAAVTSTAGSAATFGSRIELRGVLAADGSVTIGQTIASGTEVVAATSAANTLQSAWSAPTLIIVAGVGVTGFLALSSLKIAAGVQTLATMRTLAVQGIASVTNTLSPISATAERAWFGQPMFTVEDTGTGTLLTATATPRADQLVRIFKVNVSFSAAPGSIPIIIYDGDTTIIWQARTSATGKWVYHFDFSKKPLRGSRGNPVYVYVPSGGAAVVSTVSFDGDFVRAP